LLLLIPLLVPQSLFADTGKDCQDACGGNMSCQITCCQDKCGSDQSCLNGCCATICSVFSGQYYQDCYSFCTGQTECCRYNATCEGMYPNDPCMDGKGPYPTNCPYCSACCVAAP
jgi:hypothetical protein